MTDDEPLILPRDRPGFARRTVRIDPGDCWPFLAEDWLDCLVIVENGELDLEATSGARHTCRGGDVLWLVGLPLRGLANRGERQVVITTMRRG